MSSVTTDIISWQVALTGSILTTGGTFLGTMIAESDLTTVLAAVLSAAIAGQCADAFSVGSSNVERTLDWSTVGIIFGIESIYNLLVLISIGTAILGHRKYQKTSFSKKVSIQVLLGLVVAGITIITFFSLTAAFKAWNAWWLRFIVILLVGTSIFALTYVLDKVVFKKYVF